MSINLKNANSKSQKTSETLINIDSNIAKPITPSSSSSFYESQTLLCKNKCGYYGNSMQYDGYCSICYRRLKQARQQHQSSFASKTSNSLQSIASFVNNSSFDDSSSLLSPSYSFSNNLYSLDERKESKNNQIWNEQTNFSKFTSKKKQQSETRRNSTFKIFRRPSSTLVAAVDTVTKAADKAVNIVDQSITSSHSSSALASNGTVSTSSINLPSFNQLANNFLMNANMADANFIEFTNSLNRLVSSPSSTTAATSSLYMHNKTNGHSDNQKSLISTDMAIAEFEEQFGIYFPQLYQDIYKKMKNFVDKFIEAFRRKDELVFNGNKQYEVVQEFFKSIYKYIQTSASIRAYLEKSASFAAAQLDSQQQQVTSLNASGGDSSFDMAACSSPSQQNNMEDAEKINEAIMIMVESFVTANIYDYVFPTLMSEFEEQDMNLQKRIRSFYWITNEMIGTCIDENSIFYRDAYEEALNYIVEMDSKRTAHEKMLCITECSKNIYKAINITASIKNNMLDIQSVPSSPTSDDVNSSLADELNANNVSTISSKNNSKSFATADDYLPAFIYIVLKANPTMLYSNMNFVSRFAFEKRILQGEHAYHFCSLNAIITHIENLNGQHLNMSEEEFESHCNGSNEQSGNSNIFKLIQANLKILAELRDKQKMLKQEAFKLQNDMNTFRNAVQTNFYECLLNNKSKYTNNIEGFHRPVAKNFMDELDQLSGDETKLLQPIKPTSIGESTSTSTTKPLDDQTDHKNRNKDEQEDDSVYQIVQQLISDMVEQTVTQA